VWYGGLGYGKVWLGMVRCGADRLGLFRSGAVGSGLVRYGEVPPKTEDDVKASLKVVGDVSNGGASTIDVSKPYAVAFDLVGTSDMLFHRWNCESVAEKAKAAKGSKAKKSDDVESYVWRDDEGSICIPFEYVRQTMIMAAKYRQNPHSPRKSMFDMAKAAFVPIGTMSSLGVKHWDYEHTSRVTVQRNGITRTRPAIKAGWRTSFEFQVILPEYVSPDIFRDLLDNAGRLCGLGDFRPTYGRFRVESFEII